LGENENYVFEIKTEVEIDSKNSKLNADETKETKITNVKIQCG